VRFLRCPCVRAQIKIAGGNEPVVAQDVLDVPDGATIEKQSSCPGPRALPGDNWAPGKPRSTASGMPWLRAHGVPEEYVQRVIDIAILTNTALPKSSPNRSG